MIKSTLYHARRLLLSYIYEYLVQIIAWLLDTPRKNYFIIVFGLACIVAGVGFTLDPGYFSAFFGFTDLNLTALTDVRAYYGTMLVALGLVIASLSRRETAKAALLIIIAFSLGSAIGRFIGMYQGVSPWGIHGLMATMELVATVISLKLLGMQQEPLKPDTMPILNPATPEEFKPLTARNFTEPYAYYKMLRDDYPLYKMPGEDFYLVSRYQDIVDIAKDTESISNRLVEILVMGRPKDPEKTSPSLIEVMGNWGVIPVDVFALQDPPVHTAERKIGHAGFNAKFVKSLESEVETLCREMLDESLAKRNMEFVQEFGWRLPMRLIIRLLGFDENDYEQIKDWCVDGIKSLSGTVSKAELIVIGKSAAQFMRYLWKGYLDVKRHPNQYPDTCFTKRLALLADDPDSIMSDQRAIATLFQLLIAGSDSSASSMGAAVRKLADEPELQTMLRNEPELIPNFIEEIFRTESAFQGHFRLTKKSITLHGQTLPPATRLFLMWASGNRDERFWDDPDTFDMHRKNGKKHLTFGHGIHACLGRELARMEIRIVIRQLLERTSRFEIVGDTPYEASIFARTMVALPLAFELSEREQADVEIKSEVAHDAA